MPRIVPVRFFTLILLPLLFAVGACFIPVREAVSSHRFPNRLGEHTTQELDELLAAIDQEKVLDKQDQETLKQEIEKLRQEVENKPLTQENWETVDALRERLKTQVDNSSALNRQAEEAAELLSKVSDSENPIDLPVEQLERLEKSLTEMLQKMLDRGALDKAPSELREHIQRLMKDGKLQLPTDPKDRKELLSELSEFLDSEAKKLSDLRSKCKKCGKCRGEGEGEGEEGEHECEGAECDGNCKEGRCRAGRKCSGANAGNIPGRGGVTRGRADAELTYGDESDKQGTKFKETILPPGFLDKPKDQVLAITRTAPKVEETSAGDRDAARTQDPASGRETWSRTLNPKHRATIRKYFDNAPAPTNPAKATGTEK